ncbi:MAG: HEAT repeat domain-containing protein, partial [Candidatus Omnitrophota bacterium]
ENILSGPHDIQVTKDRQRFKAFFEKAGQNLRPADAVQIVETIGLLEHRLRQQGFNINHFYDEVFSNIRKEVVTGAMDIIFEIIKQGFFPTEQLIALARDSQDRDELYRDWQAKSEQIKSGDFNINNSLHIEMEYSTFRRILDNSRIVSQTHKKLSYKEYLVFVKNNSRTVNVMAKEKAELKYAAYEAGKLQKFIDKVKEHAVTMGRDVWVMPNLSYGRFAAVFMEGGLRLDDIEVVFAKIGSSQTHENPYYIDPGFLRSQVLYRLIEERPIVIVVDGSMHIDRYPDAHQAYINLAIVLDDVISNGQFSSYGGLVGRNGSFIRKLKRQSDFRAIRKTVQKAYDSISAQDSSLYSFYFWNPRGVKLKIRSSWVRRRGTMGHPKPVEVKNIKGPAFIFVNSVLTDGDLPREVKEKAGNIEHDPAFFDDVSDINIANLLFKFDSTGVHLADKMHELEMRAVDEMVGRETRKIRISSRTRTIIGKEKIQNSDNGNDVATSTADQNTIKIRRLIDELGQRNSKIRAEAAMALSEFVGNETITTVLRKTLLNDRNKDVRYWVASSLGVIGVKDSVLDLSEALVKDSNAEVRKESARAIGKLADNRAIPYLARSLSKDRDTDVRREVILALRSIRAQEVLPIILKSFKGDANPVIRAVAAEAYLDVGRDSVVVEALGYLNDRDEFVRAILVEGIGDLTDCLGDHQALAAERLSNLLLEDRSAIVREKLAWALGQIGNPYSLETIEDTLANEKSESVKQMLLWAKDRLIKIKESGIGLPEFTQQHIPDVPLDGKGKGTVLTMSPMIIDIEGRNIDISRIDTFVFDLDDTLAFLGQPISVEINEKLIKLLRHGKHVAIVTTEREENTENRVYRLIPKELRGNLHIYSNGGTIGFGFDQNGEKVVHYRFALPETEREEILKIIYSVFGGKDYKIKPAIYKVKITVARCAKKQKKKFAAAIQAALHVKGIDSDVCFQNERDINVLSFHKVHAVRDLISRFAIAEENMLIIADSARSFGRDRKLLTCFRDSVSVNVGSDSPTIELENPNIIQVSAKNLNGTNKILHEINELSFQVQFEKLDENRSSSALLEKNNGRGMMSDKSDETLETLRAYLGGRQMEEPGIEAVSGMFTDENYINKNSILNNILESLEKDREKKELFKKIKDKYRLSMIKNQIKTMFYIAISVSGILAFWKFIIILVEKKIYKSEDVNDINAKTVGSNSETESSAILKGGVICLIVSKILILLKFPHKKTVFLLKPVILIGSQVSVLFLNLTEWSKAGLQLQVTGIRLVNMPVKLYALNFRSRFPEIGKNYFKSRKSSSAINVNMDRGVYVNVETALVHIGASYIYSAKYIEECVNRLPGLSPGSSSPLAVIGGAAIISKITSNIIIFVKNVSAFIRIRRFKPQLPPVDERKTSDSYYSDIYGRIGNIREDLNRILSCYSKKLTVLFAKDPLVEYTYNDVGPDEFYSKYLQAINDHINKFLKLYKVEEDKNKVFDSFCEIWAGLSDFWLHIYRLKCNNPKYGFLETLEPDIKCIVIREFEDAMRTWCLRLNGGMARWYYLALAYNRLNSAEEEVAEELAGVEQNKNKIDMVLAEDGTEHPFYMLRNESARLEKNSNRLSRVRVRLLKSKKILEPFIRTDIWGEGEETAVCIAAQTLIEILNNICCHALKNIEIQPSRRIYLMYDSGPLLDAVHFLKALMEQDNPNNLVSSPADTYTTENTGKFPISLAQILSFSIGLSLSYFNFGIYIAIFIGLGTAVYFVFKPYFKSRYFNVKKIRETIKAFYNELVALNYPQDAVVFVCSRRYSEMNFLLSELDRITYSKKDFNRLPSKLMGVWKAVFDFWWGIVLGDGYKKSRNDLSLNQDVSNLTFGKISHNLTQEELERKVAINMLDVFERAVRDFAYSLNGEAVLEAHLQIVSYKLDKILAFLDKRIRSLKVMLNNLKNNARRNDNKTSFKNAANIEDIRKELGLLKLSVNLLTRALSELEKDDFPTTSMDSGLLTVKLKRGLGFHQKALKLLSEIDMPEPYWTTVKGVVYDTGDEMEILLYEITSKSKTSGVSSSVNSSVDIEFIKNEKPLYQRITVSDEEGHFHAVTYRCGQKDPFLSNLQPSCGGLIFKEIGEISDSSKSEADADAKAKALVIDRTCLLFNIGKRGAVTVLLSDGSAKKVDVLREWAQSLAGESLLGWQYKVTSGLGLSEKEMAVITDAAYEVYAKRITDSDIRSYLLKEEFGNETLPINRKRSFKERFIEVSMALNKGDWINVPIKLFADMRVANPAAGCPEEMGGYPIANWQVDTAGFTESLRILLRWSAERGSINKDDLSVLGVDTEKLFNELVSLGYIDEGGVVNDSVFGDIDCGCLSGISEPMNRQIYNILKRNRYRGQVMLPSFINNFFTIRLPRVIIYGAKNTGCSILRAIINRFYDELDIIGIGEGAKGVYKENGLTVSRMRGALRCRARESSLLDHLKETAEDLAGEELLAKPADILIIADKHYRFTNSDIENINSAVVIEAVPGVLSEEQIKSLGKRGIYYISSIWLNAADLYSAREEDIHTRVLRERMHIKDIRTHVLSGIEGLAATLMFEELYRTRNLGHVNTQLSTWEVGKSLAMEIESNIGFIWSAIEEFIRLSGLKLDDICNITDVRQLILNHIPESLSESYNKIISPVLIRFRTYIEQGRDPEFAWVSAVFELGWLNAVYNENSEQRAIEKLQAGRSTFEAEIAAWDCRWLKPDSQNALDALVNGLANKSSHRVRRNCAHSLGVIFGQLGDPNLRGKVVVGDFFEDPENGRLGGIVSALLDFYPDVYEWAHWAISIGDMPVDGVITVLQERVNKLTKEQAGLPEYGLYRHKEAIGYTCRVMAALYDYKGDRRRARDYREKASENYKYSMFGQYGHGALICQLEEARSAQQNKDFPEAVAGYLSLVNPYMILKTWKEKGAVIRIDDMVAVESFIRNIRVLALAGILNIFYPYNLDENMLAAKRLDEVIFSLNALFASKKWNWDRANKLEASFVHQETDLAQFDVPYLGLLLIIGTGLFNKHTKYYGILKHVLMRGLLSDNAEKISGELIKSYMENKEAPFNRLTEKEHNFIKYLFAGLGIIPDVQGTDSASSSVGPLSYAPAVMHEGKHIIAVNGALRLFAVGDVHADVNMLHVILQESGLMDDKAQVKDVIAGDSHNVLFKEGDVLVFLGDMIDTHISDSYEEFSNNPSEYIEESLGTKTPNLDTVRYLRALKLMASSFGAYIIFIRGNHDEIIDGVFRYLNVRDITGSDSDVNIAKNITGLFAEEANFKEEYVMSIKLAVQELFCGCKTYRELLKSKFAWIPEFFLGLHYLAIVDNTVLAHASIPQMPYYKINSLNDMEEYFKTDVKDRGILLSNYASRWMNNNGARANRLLLYSFMARIFGLSQQRQFYTFVGHDPHGICRGDGYADDVFLVDSGISWFYRKDNGLPGLIRLTAEGAMEAVEVYGEFSAVRTLLKEGEQPECVLVSNNISRYRAEYGISFDRRASSSVGKQNVFMRTLNILDTLETASNAPPRVSSVIGYTHKLRDDVSGKHIFEIQRKPLICKRNKVLFVTDVHGTLLKPTWKDELRYAYGLLTNSRAPSDEWISRHILNKSKEVIEKDLASVTGKTLEEVKQAIRLAREHYLNNDENSVNPGVESFLRAITNAGILVIAVSGTNAEVVNRQLRRAGLSRYITDVIGGEVSGNLEYNRAAVIADIQIQYSNYTIVFSDDLWNKGFDTVYYSGGIAVGVPQGR